MNAPALASHSSYRSIARYVGPSIAASTLTIIYSLTDTYFISRLGTAEVAAISVAFPLYNLFGILGILAGSGAASYISRFLGAGKPRHALEYSGSGLLWYLLLSVPAVGICYLSAPFLLPAFGSTEQIRPFAEQYLFIMIPASLLGGINIYAGMALRSWRYPGFALAALLSGTLINIAADPLLIFLFRKGVAGAAWASFTGQGVTLLFYTVFLSRKTRTKGGERKKPVKLVRAAVLLRFTGTGRRLLPLGSPVAAGQIFVGIIFALAQLFAKHFGNTEGVAAAGIVLRLYAAALFLLLGFTRGVQPLAGMAFGNENYRQLRKLLFRSAAILLLFTSLITCIALFVPGRIMNIFSQDLKVRNMGTVFLRFAFAGCIPFAFQLFASGIFQALGSVGKTFFLLFFRNVFLLLPAMIILPNVLGVNGIFLSFTAADGISFIVLLFLTKKLPRVIPEKGIKM